jgi:hypothetical protein
MNKFISDTCEAVDFDRKGNFLVCGRRAPHVEEPELIAHCDVHHEEWVKAREPKEVVT